MYVNIEHYKSNEGSFGEITEKDLSEILDILNLEKYMEREVASEELNDSDLKEIRSEHSFDFVRDTRHYGTFWFTIRLS